MKSPISTATGDGELVIDEQLRATGKRIELKLPTVVKATMQEANDEMEYATVQTLLSAGFEVGL